MGIVGSLVVTTALYIATAGVLVLMVPYTQVPAARRPRPPAATARPPLPPRPRAAGSRLSDSAPSCGRLRQREMDRVRPAGPRPSPGVCTVSGLKAPSVAILGTSAGSKPDEHVFPEPMT